MLLLLSKAATLFSLLLLIPAIISALLILKEYTILTIRFAKYFKLLLFQGFVHSILLVLAMFFADFKTPFLIHSFGMIPLYGLLLFRNYHLKYIREAWSEAVRTIALPKKKVASPRIDPAKLKSIRLVGQTRSRWH